MGTAPGPEHAERALQQLRRERRPVAEEQDERLMESRHHASAMVTQDATPYHARDGVDNGMGQAVRIEAQSKGLRRASKTVSDQSLVGEPKRR